MRIPAKGKVLETPACLKRFHMMWSLEFVQCIQSKYSSAIREIWHAQKAIWVASQISLFAVMIIAVNPI